MHYAVHGPTAAEVIVDREILQDADRVTAELAKTHAESAFEKYRIVQDRLFESDFDRMIHNFAANPK